MPPISVDNVIETNSKINRYRFRLESLPGLVQRGEIQRKPFLQHILLGRDLERFPQAEIFWRAEREGEIGIGRNTYANKWMPLGDKSIPDYLGLSLELLKRINLEAAREDDRYWMVDHKSEDLPVLKDPNGFFTKIFGEPTDRKSQKFFDNLLEVTKLLKVYSTIYISKISNLITQIDINVEIRGKKRVLTFFFESLEANLPDFPENIRLFTNEKIISGRLLIGIPKLGGWDWPSHGPWAQRSINLIKEKDEYKRYREIYSTEWKWFKEDYTEEMARAKNPSQPATEGLHHPIVLGAGCEDNDLPFPNYYNEWFGNDPRFAGTPNFQKNYYRSFHHYGGHETGLEYKLYFEAVALSGGVSPPPRIVNDRYYSARDWGYGGNRIDENLNRMTFVEAIRQYNRYSEEGKRNAFLIIGHVIHLLQDVGEPDHARLVAHPASGYNEKEAYEKWGVCHVLATETFAAACAACSWILGVGCLFCGGISFGAVEAACYASIDENEMGFEKLIGEKWNLVQIKDKIAEMSPLNALNYDTFFQDVADFAINKADEKGLKSALGCSALKYFPLIPDCDPDINSNDGNQCLPYITLTNEVAPRIIGYSAGLIQYFYEIVNHPPFVQRVVIIQGPLGLVPDDFTKLPAPANEVYYDSQWIDQVPGDLKIRNKDTPVNKPMNPDLQAYMFIQFGPNLPPLKSKAVKQETLNVRLYTENNGINIEIPMKSAQSPAIGTYYWGTFQLKRTQKPYKLQLEIQAEDASAHLIQRHQGGHQLDSNPGTVARANVDDPPLYNFISYEPGADKNHLLDVGQSRNLNTTIIAWQILE
jgi:hypothetical protein